MNTLLQLILPFIFGVTNPFCEYKVFQLSLKSELDVVPYTVTQMTYAAESQCGSKVESRKMRALSVAFYYFTLTWYKWKTLPYITIDLL